MGTGARDNISKTFDSIGYTPLGLIIRVGRGERGPGHEDRGHGDRWYPDRGHGDKGKRQHVKDIGFHGIHTLTVLFLRGERGHETMGTTRGTYVHMCVSMYLRMYICVYVCMYVCMYACMYLCMYVSMYMSSGQNYMLNLMPFTN